MTTFAQTKIVDGLLEGTAEHLFHDYSWLEVGTGTTGFSDSATELTNGTAMSASSHRKVKDSTSTGSFRNGRYLVFHWNVDQGEPTTQPILIGEEGLFRTNGTVANAGVLARLNATQTKDSTVRHRVRASLSILRISEVL